MICHYAAMKKILLYIPIVLSLLVLGAHFLREGNAIAVGGAVALAGLLFITQPWVARLQQAALALGTLEWMHTLYVLVQVRTALDQPYTRMVVILSIVALVTFCSALLFQTQTLKSTYGSEKPQKT